MAFQDFDLITERRKAEKQRKLKKRIVIGVVSTIVLVGIIAGAAFVVVTGSSNSDDKKAQSPPSGHTKEISHGEKMVKMVCNSTDYKDKCESTLKKAVKSNPKVSQPKDLLKIAIAAALEEVDKAFSKTKSFKFNSPEEKAAFDDCGTLLQDAKDELESSVSEVGSNDLKKLATRTDDLNNWLSAVMSYHQTCIDGFPDGKLKTDIQNTLNRHQLSEKEGFSSYVTPGSTGASDNLDDIPYWISQNDRRILKANDEKPTSNVTVAKDGSGKFKTISEALKAMPAKYQGRYVIYVKEGIYDETVTVTKNMINVTMYGDGSQKSIITGRKNFVDGVSTFQTASFAALGDGFIGKAMGFRNTAGPEKHQAVAARVQADRAAFVNCRFEGYQDTLYAQTHRQFYRSCVVTGTIDFIFGDAAAIFQNCLIFIRKPLENQQNIVTAQGRIDRRETTGIVLQSCQIKADDSLTPVKSQFKSYLGRPWKEYSRTIIMDSTIEDIIHPDGFLPWQGEFALKTLYYAEYNNKGSGAKVTARVKWPGYKVINKQEAFKYTVGPFLQGSWLNGTGVPVKFGLYV
ncbi:Pectinesterase [Quillaja saponaria]|uniref:Pectinesterase n=1 Tax=Quillaja saponaria TaxID=32244 RepID=A0AAD7LC33_QUISA|nr:Pectinesterase [Quillaja saponaria]